MNLKRSLALALSLVMLLAIAVPMAGAANELPRIAGANRYLTAVEVSQEGWENTAAVVLARGDNIADALAGVPFAHSIGAPILLTPSNRLHDATIAEIERLHAHLVYILGGEGAISAEVETALEDLGLTVERIAGDNRFETAAKIAMKVDPNATKVVLVNGLEWPDALSAAPYAAMAGIPILTTGPNSLSAAAEKALKDLGVEEIIVVGGPAVISDNVFNALTLRSPKRVFGSNRYGTGVALAKEFNLTSTNVYFASGLEAGGGVDAIAGAVLAAQQGTGLFLVGNGLDSITAQFIKDQGIMAATIFGGEGAVVPARATQLAKALVPAGGSGIAGWVDPSAEVTVAGKSIKADKDTGFYTITGIPTGDHTVSYYKLGKKIHTEPVTVLKDGISKVTDVTLENAPDKSAIVIDGYVIDPNSDDVNGVVVTVERWDTKKAKYVATGITDTTALGSFSLSNTGDALNFGDKVKLTFTKGMNETLQGAYKTFTKELTLKLDEATNYQGGLTMTPVQAMTVSGKVTGTDSAVQVDFGYLDKNGNFVGTTSPQTTSTDTGKEGTFEFKDLTLPSGTYIFQVDTENTAVKALHNVAVTVTEGKDLVYNPALVTGYKVSMTIGVEQVGQTFTSGGDYTAAFYKGDALVSEANPTVDPATLTATWDRIAPGTYTVKLYGDHLVDKNFTVNVGAANAELVSRVYVAGALDGQVTDESTNAVKDATVELLKKDGTKVAETTTDTDGNYVFGGLLGGATEYRVRVTSTGFKTHDDKDDNLETVLNGETVSFDTVVLAKPATTAKVEGIVRGNTGEKVAEGKVYYHAIDVLDEDGDAYDLNFEVDSAEIEGGQYDIEDLLPGFYRVVVRSSGYENYVTTLRVKADDDLKKVNYTQSVGGNAKLTVTVDQTPTTAFSVKDAFGFEVAAAAGTIEDLPAGTYYVTAEVAGYLNYKGSITVAKGKEASFAITMVAGATEQTITFQLFGVNYGSVTADKIVAGGKEFTGNSIQLAPGTYTAKIYADYYLVGSVSFTVKKDGSGFTLAPMMLTSWTSWK